MNLLLHFFIHYSGELCFILLISIQDIVEDELCIVLKGVVLSSLK
jgi:hypothetical protein